MRQQMIAAVPPCDRLGNRLTAEIAAGPSL
jgi:hypothetical protein